MPMQSCAFFWPGYFIVDSDHKSVSPVGLERRRRKLPIDQENTRVHSVWCNKTTCNGKIILTNHTSIWRVGVWVCVFSCVGTPWITVWKRLTCRSVGNVSKVKEVQALGVGKQGTRKVSHGSRGPRLTFTHVICHETWKCRRRDSPECGKPFGVRETRQPNVHMVLTGALPHHW